MPATNRSRWTLLRCAGGAPILGLLTGGRWRGWEVPWFPDASMEAMGKAYFGSAEPERSPYQSQTGEWEYRDDDDEIVLLERHRKTVVLGGRRGSLALNDAAEMCWCWEEVPVNDGTAATLASLLSEVERDFTPHPARAGARSRRRGK